MIKGRYVSTVEIDISIDEKEYGIKPYEQLKNDIENDLNNEIKALLEDEIGEEYATITVTQQSVEIHRES